MSARGRRAHRPEPAGPPEFAWILLVLAAALVGGLAAAALVHTSLIIAVVVSVGAAAIAVLALRTSPAPPRGQATYRASPASPPPGAPVHGTPRPGAPIPDGPAPGGPAPGDPVPGGSVPGQAGYDGQTPPRPPAPAETLVQMLPLPHQPGEETRSADPPWWDPAPGAAPRPGRGTERVPAPDLTTYLASTFIAQCPRCGAFGLDIRQAENVWDFRCEACQYTWAWQPGTAWPPVRVMPGRRRELPPPRILIRPGPLFDFAAKQRRQCNV